MMLPSLGYFSEVPCVFFLAGSCKRPHCHFRHCARDKTNDDGKVPSLPKTVKDAQSEWLGPNLRLSQVTHMVEKAVDRALLANPDKKLDRATMISQAIETLRRDSLATAAVNHRNASSNPSTSAGFPSYKPTPISVLNKRHIPVAAMPVKPMVVRKEKRPDEKALTGASPVITAPHNFTSHTSKLDVESDAESLPNSVTSSEVGLAENNDSESESPKLPLIQQISDFVGTELGTNSTSNAANNDNEIPSPPFSLESESSGHSNADSLDANIIMGKQALNQVVGNQPSDVNVDITNKKSDALLHSSFETDVESNVPFETDKCIDEQRNEDIDVVIQQKEKVLEKSPVTTEEMCNKPDPLPKKHEDLEHHQERSRSIKAPDRRHTCDTTKSSDSHKKSDKSVHRSSKRTKVGKSDLHKQPGKEKNGDDRPKKEKQIKVSERESCHIKPSRHNVNVPKKCLSSDDQSKSHPKKSGKGHHEKKAHHKSQDENSEKQKKKHHHEQDDSENVCKREFRNGKSKTDAERSSISNHPSSSHRKSKSNENRSSSRAKDHDKARKRKSDEEYEKRIKVAKVKNERENNKEKSMKLDSNDISPLGSGEIDGLVEIQSRTNSSSRAATGSVKRKCHSDSDNDVDLDSPGSGHTAIVISSSSSDECMDEWASSPAKIQYAEKSDEEGTDSGAQTTVVDFKWSKAKEIIQRSTNSKMPRIAHVPNVMNMLTAKTRLMSQERKPVTKPATLSTLPSSATRSNEHDEGPKPKIMRRVAHGSQGTESRPVVKLIDNVKLPPGIRQHYCNVFYDELCKYVDPEKAKTLAVEEELDVAKRCKIHKIYQNNCSLLLLKIRKMKGNIGKGEQAAIKWTGSSSPEFTFGLTLYKCFEKYLVPDEDLIKNAYAMPLPGQPTCAYIEKSARKYSVPQPDEPFKRRCVNCRKTYEIDQNGMPTTMNDCNYHWGRMRKVGGRSLQVEKYTCCDGADDSVPCQSNAYHVWSGKNEDCIPGFVKTKEWPDYRNESDAGVYALDCEMCYTTRGLELARLTVVDLNEDVIFDEVIALENPVLDYCTRFSGIDEIKMRQATLTFQDVQNWVLDNFFDKTILIGHSLENDLNALKVFHKRIVDTSITFPHKFGPPMKNSLKNLAMSVLAIPIQENEQGHDSKEDAVTCLKLMMKRIKEDAKVRKPRVIIGYAGKKR